MDVRSTRVCVAAVVALVALALPRPGRAATFSTPNFIVTTQSPQHAKEFALEAEKLRDELAVLWTGKKFPRWWRPAVVRVNVGQRLSGGGETSFQFDRRRNEVYGWRMSIQGSYERVLDSVLPHEITHMVFASHFRRPVPRWADEGAAVSAECHAERSRHRRMLVRFLQTGYGIPFSRMYAITQYPRDMNQMLTLYAQGFSVTEYLIAMGGHRKFVQYIEDGLNTGDWAGATANHYGYESLRSMQQRWNKWVASGFPKLESQVPSVPKLEEPAPETAVAANDVGHLAAADVPKRLPSGATPIELADLQGEDRSIYDPDPRRRLEIDLAVRPVSATAQSPKIRPESELAADGLAPVPAWSAARLAAPQAAVPADPFARFDVSTTEPQVLLEWSRY